MIPIARPFFGPEEERAVAEVLRSGWVAQGPTTAALEDEFAAASGVPFAIATSSATTALHLAVVACGVQPGDEVVLPSYTFPATANAVLYAGGIPVLADIDPATLNLDVAAAEAALTARTRAVIGVHLFGAPCAIRELESLCGNRGIALIEDAACAIGTRVDGRAAGGFGDVGCFSFHARKVVTCGEGGMLTTRSEEKAELMRSLRTHGADRSAEQRHAEGAAPADALYARLGYNYRLSDVQAAIARVQLGRLDAFVRERRALAARYDEALGPLPGLRLPPQDAGHSYQSYVVVLESGSPIEPAPFMAALAARGVSTRVGTYAVHRQPYLADCRRGPGGLAASEEAAKRSVALPLFNGLSKDDQDRVIDAVQATWKQTSAN
ncbi:DegT/DnrJ/EryC1/StrS family aminotransferase [bacterium]|nr:DegT/DnrJ/EryC1/StrS family aminotransferase [bacterium]